MTLPFRVDLQGRVAVVTGGGGVLCGRFAEALAESGARVALFDIKEEGAEAVAAGIRRNGGDAMAVRCDVLSTDSIRGAERAVAERFGRCDILINGAGGNHPLGTTTKEFLEPEDLKAAREDVLTFFDLDPAGVQFVFNLNVLGTLLPTQVFARGMAGAPGAVIINISSMNAFTPLTKIPAYSAAKAAVSNLTQWLAVHFSRVGIRVNAMAPGFFLTEQNRSLLIAPDGTRTPRAERIISQTPMGRFGLPEDLVGTLLWLVDEGASGFVNGVVIPVDGGFSAYSGV
ncbi:MAG: SDR family oxidoreductase [Spirochaetes bacterium]|nr:SDR family oxidoreductase [Spirochaetota bacterium]